MSLLISSGSWEGRALSNGQNTAALGICVIQSVRHFLGPKNQEIGNFFLKKSGDYQEFFSIKSKIISKWLPSPL